MKLRLLKNKDSEPMLEWMHDKNVVNKLHTDFEKKTLEDCISFIASSVTEENVHMAITDDNDNYMGTVSLKHITSTEAEFAITICADAMGKGYSIWAMNEMLNKGFNDYGLEYIYWCVAKDNIRALRFYDKNNFERVCSDSISIAGDYTREEIDSYIWYKEINNKNNKR